MASNHTTNYQLPKWEKTDRIQMSDFNDMTATLDAALKANADAIAAETAARIADDPYPTICEVVTAQAKAQVSMDLSAVDLTEYSHIDLTIDPPAPVSSSYSVLVRPNGLTSGYQLVTALSNYSSPTYLLAYPIGASTCGLFSTPTPNGVVSCFGFNDSYFHYTYASCKWGELQTLVFVPDPNGTVKSIPAGTRFRLKGWKK